MSRVVKPISLSADDHSRLLQSAAVQEITLKELVESIIRLFIATIQRGDAVIYSVPQKVNATRAYAISTSVVEQVKKVSHETGVSQVNIIYSALKWHLSSEKGVSVA